MTRLLALACVALIATGCGMQAPTPGQARAWGAAPAAQAVNASKRVNVYTSDDLEYICEQTLKDHEDAKANKTNAARLETVLAHAETVAKKQGNTKAAAIAAAEQERQHELAKGVTGNLPAKVARLMCDGCLDAFRAILKTL